jgi:hypothetical protein
MTTRPYDEEIHCHTCKGRGGTEHRDCPDCDGTGYQPVEVGYRGQPGAVHALAPSFPPSRTEVRTLCGQPRALPLPLTSRRWISPTEADHYVDCYACLGRISEWLRA